MKFPKPWIARRRDSPVAMNGVARKGTRTKALISDLRHGEIAVIDHCDIDRIAADDLVRCQPCAVLNASSSSTGRYPNGGPTILVESGVMLLDNLGDVFFNEIKNGDVLELRGNEVWRRGELLGRGDLQTRASIERSQILARSNIDQALEEFAANTLEYIKLERGLVLDPIQMPLLVTRISGRHALVVVRGADYRDDLAHLKTYIRELRPVIIAVDGGADALLDIGRKPDMIVGDFDSISDKALHCGAELVLHTYHDGTAPGRERLDTAGVDYQTIPLAGTSEDAALLMAYESGAELIVAVGTHASMVEFLDKGRAGMSSTFLTRLKVGRVLVDAKGVSRLYEGRVRKTDLGLFVVAIVACFAAIIAVAYPLQVFLHAGWLILRRGL